MQTATVLPLTSHLSNHHSKTNKAYWALLVKFKRTHKPRPHRVDTGYSREDLPRAMDDREGWGERERERVCVLGGCVLSTLLDDDDDDDDDYDDMQGNR